MSPHIANHKQLGLLFVTDASSDDQAALYQIYNNARTWSEFGHRELGNKQVDRLVLICVGATPRRAAKTMMNVHQNIIIDDVQTMPSTIECYVADRAKPGPMFGNDDDDDDDDIKHVEALYASNHTQKNTCEWIGIGGGPPVGFCVNKIEGNVRAWFQLGTDFVGKHIGRGVYGGDTFCGHDMSDEYKVQMDVNMKYLQMVDETHFEWVSPTLTRKLNVDALSLLRCESCPAWCKDIVWTKANDALMSKDRPSSQHVKPHRQVSAAFLNLQQLVGCTASHPVFGPSIVKDKASVYHKDNMMDVNDVKKVCCGDSNDYDDDDDYKAHKVKDIRACFSIAKKHAESCFEEDDEKRERERLDLTLVTTLLFLYQNLVERHGGLKACFDLIENKANENGVDVYTYAPLAVMESVVGANMAALWCVRKHTYDRLMATYQRKSSALAELDYWVNHFDCVVDEAVMGGGRGAEASSVARHKKLKLEHVTAMNERYKEAAH